jgi:hypothetical protein
MHGATIKIKSNLSSLESSTTAVDRDKWPLHTQPGYLSGQNSGGPLDRTLCGTYRRLGNFGGEKKYLCLPRIELRIVEYRFYNTFDDNFKPFLYEGHTGWTISNSAHGITDFSGSSNGWSV